MKSFVLGLSVLLSMSSYAFAKSTSVYTSVAADDCTTIASSEQDPEPEIDYYTGHCAGQAGYTVVISGGDLRYPLSLIYQGQGIVLTNIAWFHDVGSSKVEWRGFVGNDGKIARFHSLIYRLKIDEYDGSNATWKNNEVLFVVRLNGAKSCVIGEVPRSASMNVKAREIADDLTKPCLL